MWPGELINADAYVINTHRTCHLYIIQTYNTTGVMWRGINATRYTSDFQNFTDLPKTAQFILIRKQL